MGGICNRVGRNKDLLGSDVENGGGGGGGGAAGGLSGGGLGFGWADHGGGGCGFHKKCDWGQEKTPHSSTTCQVPASVSGTGP